jgi:hypothetical protein
MRKYKRPKVNKWSKFKPVTAATIKRAAAKALENDFVSKLFIHVIEEEERPEGKAPGLL